MLEQIHLLSPRLGLERHLCRVCARFRSPHPQLDDLLANDLAEFLVGLRGLQPA